MNPISPASIGWLTVVFLLVQFSLGIFTARSNSPAGTSPLRGKITRNVHMIMGFLLLPLAFMHGWISMMVKGSAAANQFGMWMATFALLLLVIQILWGIGLLRQSGATRRRSRKIHLGVAIGIVCLAGTHLLLNH